MAVLIFSVGIFAILKVISSLFFFAKSYSNLIERQEGVFKDDVKPINFNQIPVVDKETAERLGSRKLGEIGGELGIPCWCPCLPGPPPTRSG